MTASKMIPDSTYTRPCDLKIDSFVLQPDRLNTSTPLKGKLTNCHASGCERPFSVQKIPHSNLILLVVDTLCPCGSKQLDIGPQEVIATPGKLSNQIKKQCLAILSLIWLEIISGTCNHRRMQKERLARKRPSKCINYHPEEIEIQQCGGASTPFSQLSAILLNIIIVSQVWLLTA